jgi:hypothetical protein
MKKALLSIVVFVFVFTAISQDDCSKALEFKDIIKINRSGNTFQDVHNWFISQNGREVTSSSGWDANVAFTLYGVPIKLGGGSNSADYEKLANAINTGNKAVFIDNFVDFVYKEILKPEAYEAWINCIKEKQKTQIELGKQRTIVETGKQQVEIEKGKQQVEMVRIKIEQKGLMGMITDETDESFVLKLKWQPTVGVNSVKIQTPIVRGAKYIQNAIDLNAEIGTEYVSIPFYKIKGSNVSIIINTVGNVGSFSATLKPTSKSYQKTFNLDGALSKDAYHVHDFDEYSGVLFTGDYLFKPNISLTKNNSSDIVEQSTITGTIEIKITKASKHRNDVGFGASVGEHGGFEFTKEQQAFVDARLNKKFSITFKAVANKTFHASNNSFEGCYYKMASCTQTVANGLEENLNCNSLLTITLQYKKVDINGDELPCEISVSYKDLGVFHVKAKLMNN